MSQQIIHDYYLLKNKLENYIHHLQTQNTSHNCQKKKNNKDSRYRYSSVNYHKYNSGVQDRISQAFLKAIRKERKILDSSIRMYSDANRNQSLKSIDRLSQMKEQSKQSSILYSFKDNDKSKSRKSIKSINKERSLVSSASSQKSQHSRNYRKKVNLQQQCLPISLYYNCQSCGRFIPYPQTQKEKKLENIAQNNSNIRKKSRFRPEEINKSQYQKIGKLQSKYLIESYGGDS